MFRFSLFFSLVIFLFFCKPPELTNGCDPRTNNFLYLLLIKNALDDQSPGCVPYLNLPRNKYLSYGVFDTSSLPANPGGVNSIKLIGERLFAGGSFNTAALPTGGAAFLDTITAKPIGSTHCPQLDLYDANQSSGFGVVHSATMDTSGNLYIAGIFTHVQGFPRVNVAKIKPNCKLDRNFNANLSFDVTAVIYDILYLENRLYIAGNFRTADGPFTNFPVDIYRNTLAAVNSDSGILESWEPTITGTVITKLATDGEHIYIGGDFTNVNGVMQERLAKIHKNNPNQYLSFPYVNGAVYALEYSNGLLYIGGVFNVVNGITNRPNKLAAIDTTNNTVTSAFQFTPSFASTVYDMQILNQKIYVAGEFLGPTYVGLVEMDLVGNITKSDFGIDGAFPTVSKISPIDNELYVFGFFDSAFGAVKPGFFILDTTTNTLSNFNPKPMNQNYHPAGVALRMQNGSIFIGGAFGAVDVQERNNLVAFDTYTGLPINWFPNPSSYVVSLDSDANNLYVVGGFNTIASSLRNTTAAFSLENLTLTDWNPNFGSEGKIKIIGDHLYIFNSSSLNSPNQYLGKSNLATGAYDADFAPGFSNQVRDVFESNGRFFVAGSFTSPNNYLTSVNMFNGDPEIIHSQALGLSGGAYSVFVTDGRVLMSGLFDLAAPYNYIAIGGFNAENLSTLSLPNGSGFGTLGNFSKVMTESEDKVFLGGSFFEYAGALRTNLLALNRSDLSLHPWDPHVSGSGIETMVFKNNYLYVAGNFYFVGKYPRTSLAKINAETGIPE
ncbi:hypothetical protein P3G55_18690 [Leptospira sp. 96542]|nr:hypothetical protein [Leptospira sp. 96542]